MGTKNRVTKDMIGREIAKRYSLPAVMGNEILDYVLDTITSSLSEDKRVTLHGFGSFYARQGSKYFIVGFKASQAFKAKILAKRG